MPAPYLIRPACSRCLNTRRLPVLQLATRRRIFDRPTVPCPYC
jgi:hypothetical protein